MSFTWLAQRGLVRSWQSHRILCRACYLITQHPSAKSKVLPPRSSSMPLPSVMSYSSALDAKRSPALIKLREELKHPPASPVTSRNAAVRRFEQRSFIKRRRIYRKNLSTVYEVIRKDLAQWRQLSSQDLLAIFDRLQPTLAIDHTTRLTSRNAQHVLEDLQHHTPLLFTSQHAKHLVTSYKENRQYTEAIELIAWCQQQSHVAVEDDLLELGVAVATKQHSTIPLARQWWDRMACKTDRATGYVLQGLVLKGDHEHAARWWQQHAKSTALGSSSQGSHAPTTSPMAFVSDGLEWMLQEAVAKLDFSEALYSYELQCGFFVNHQPALQDQQIIQPFGSLSNFLKRAMAEEGTAKTLKVLFDVATELGHNTGKAMIGHRLFQLFMADKNVRRSVNFFMDHQDLIGNKTLLLQLLDSTCRAKYATDAYRLYQEVCQRYPEALDLRRYSRVMQVLLRARMPDLADQVYKDATTNQVMTTHQSRENVLAFFYTVYALCSQTGNIALFETTAAMQRAAGFPILSHRSLTCLMSAFLRSGKIKEAKAVFDHLAFSTSSSDMVSKLPSAAKRSRSPPPRENTGHLDWLDEQGDVDLDPRQEQVTDGVDVVDFNVLIRGIIMEHGSQQETQERVLAVLRHMSMVGVASDKATLRTLMDVYAQDSMDGVMEDELSDQLLGDPSATTHDHVWLNNLKLTRLIYGGINTSPRSRQPQSIEKNVFQAARIFLSNSRRQLFPSLQADTFIQANIMTYTLLIEALSRHPRHHAIQRQVFAHMRENGKLPTMDLYQLMIRSNLYRGRFQDAKDTMALLCQDYHLATPPPAIHAHYLSYLIELNKSAYAKNWVEQMRLNEMDLKHPPLTRILSKLD
ncbi:hypothetical protein DM01DRAFT_1382231 [Hesseltinella vesiculosa]|uniref:Pentacotripeptide-repeat region of PRORP domain-containing protein n=1 Tax=Hesseltinella vesiculosa TaxID=101127 RepID=A0A1X2GLQ1_9FUNG|nr:hypothetical protein DM01DRAFT_1382231 [Hesseltinella vesiculosa]